MSSLMTHHNAIRMLRIYAYRIVVKLKSYRISLLRCKIWSAVIKLNIIAVTWFLSCAMSLMSYNLKILLDVWCWRWLKLLFPSIGSLLTTFHKSKHIKCYNGDTCLTKWTLGLSLRKLSSEGAEMPDILISMKMI